MFKLNALSAIALSGVVLLPSTGFAENHVRFENALTENRYQIEGRFNVANSTDVLVSRQVNEDTAGFEYALNLAYARHTKVFTPRLIGQFDAGVAYETVGDDFATVGQMISDDFSDSSIALFTTVGINYVVTPKLFAGIDGSATQDIQNESVMGMYRSRASLVYKPFKPVSLIYRAGMTYAQNDFTKSTITNDSVAGGFLVSHELYASYKSKSGLEPYLLLKDMNNSGDRVTYAGLTYHFK